MDRFSENYFLTAHMSFSKQQPTRLLFSMGLAFVILTSSLGAQTLNKKFDTKNHSKAKGVWMTVRYPQSWQAEEGERPNIVQNFSGEYQGVNGLLMLQIKKADGDLESECRDMSVQDWKEMFQQPGLTVLNLRPTSHENQPAAIFDFSQTNARAGLVFHSYHRVMAVCYRQDLIMAWCGSVDGNATSAQKVRANMSLLAPLCTQYFNSVILMDKYK